jgi:hypothetical protein
MSEPVIGPYLLRQILTLSVVVGLFCLIGLCWLATLAWFRLLLLRREVALLSGPGNTRGLAPGRPGRNRGPKQVE